MSQKTNKSLLEQPIQHIRDLVKCRQYRHALGEAAQMRRQHPEVAEIASLEAEIWLEQGKDEARQGRYRQAIQAYQRSLDAGGTEGIYYQMAKAYLKQGNIQTALQTLQGAFVAKKLLKAEGGCYLKLLFIAEEWQQAEDVLQESAQRFSADQKEWGQGILHLHHGRLEEALAAFKKVKNNPTPGDCPLTWQIYTHQQLSQWQESSRHLLKSALSDAAILNPISEPVYRRLMISQLWQGNPDQNIRGFFKKDSSIVEGCLIQLFHYLEETNYHEAAHFLLELESFKNHYYAKLPEIKQIRRSLLLLGGQQAMDQENMECACQIWKPLIQSKRDFDPQLIYNYALALKEEEKYTEQFQMLKQLQQWVQQDAKRNPDRWADSYFKTTLAHLHCLIADALAEQGQPNAARQEVTQAIRLAPDSPEVWIRQGHIALADEERLNAIDFFTKVLEAGTKDEDVYVLLIILLEKEKQTEELSRIKKLFAKDYGDEFIPTVEIPEWVYLGMGEGIQEMQHIVGCKKEELEKTPLGASLLLIYKTFRGYSDTGYRQKRISVDLDRLELDFYEILKTIAPEYQVKALQIVCLYLLKFVNRQKGLAEIINSYLDQLKARSESDPEAHFAYIAMLAVKNVAKSTLDKALIPYLNQNVQPHQTLSDIQFHVRYFITTKALLPAIDRALAKDSQNPLLLLAKATTFPQSSPEYKTFKEQSFELARRLQDQRALERLREEKALRKDEPLFGDFNIHKVMEMLLDRMNDEDFSLDDLINPMMGDEDNNFEDEDDDDFEIPFPSPNQRQFSPDSRSKSRSKPNKGGFG